jgi:hypothetical protein
MQSAVGSDKPLSTNVFLIWVRGVAHADNRKQLAIINVQCDRNFCDRNFCFRIFIPPKIKSARDNYILMN